MKTVRLSDFSPYKTLSWSAEKEGKGKKNEKND